MREGRVAVSVVLACYNSASTLGAALSALRRQSFQDFEVIAVNSSAEQETAAVAAQFPEVLFIQSPTRLYPHAARNCGATRARGSLLVFSDPDCVADPLWLEHLVTEWRRGKRALGGAMGLVQNSWTEAAVHLCKFHSSLPGRPAGPHEILPTANAAYDRGLWEQIGPFPASFAGDSMLSWRARDAGAQPWFVPQAVVRHVHGLRAGQFLRQRFLRGREFGAIRASYENWRFAQRLAVLVGIPLLVGLVLAREARDCAQSAWLGQFLWTLPLRIAGQAAWCLGEALGCWRQPAEVVAGG